MPPEGNEQLPAGATPIDIEAIFACIGELYFQVRELRRLLARQAASSPNGSAQDAIPIEH